MIVKPNLTKGVSLEVLSKSSATAKKIVEYANKNGLQPFFGGSEEDNKKGVIGMYLCREILVDNGISEVSLEEDMAGRIITFDLTIFGKKFEVKTGRIRDDDFQGAVNNPNFAFLVGKNQKIEIKNKNKEKPFGYVAMLINSDLSKATLLGWIEESKITDENYPPQNRKQEKTTNHRIPFDDLLEIETLKPPPPPGKEHKTECRFCEKEIPEGEVFCNDDCKEKYWKREGGAPLDKAAKKGIRTNFHLPPKKSLVHSNIPEKPVSSASEYTSKIIVWRRPGRPDIRINIEGKTVEELKQIKVDILAREQVSDAERIFGVKTQTMTIGEKKALAAAGEDALVFQVKGGDFDHPKVLLKQQN